MTSMAETYSDEILQDIIVGPNRLAALRRGAAITGAAVGIFVGADLLSQRRLWRESDATEIVIDTDADGQAPGAELRWLAVPGLGQQSAQFIKEDAGDQIPGRIDYMKFSGKDISAQSVGRVLAPYFMQTHSRRSNARPEQNLLCSSMGFPTYLLGAEWCMEQGIRVPELSTVVAWSSPLHAGHTFMEKEVRLVKKFPYPGGLLSKIAVEAYQRIHEAGFKLSSLGRCAIDAFVEAPKGCPPPFWSNQIRMLADADSIKPATLDRLITGNTTLVHIGDKADHRVNIPKARPDIRRTVESRGGTYIEVDRPGSGHANVGGTNIEEALGLLPLAA